MTIDHMEQPSTRGKELLYRAQAEWGRSPLSSSSSKREKEKESGEAWPGSSPRERHSFTVKLPKSHLPTARRYARVDVDRLHTTFLGL